MLNVKKLTAVFMVTLAILFYVPSGASAQSWTKHDTSQAQLIRYASHVLYGVWSDGEQSVTITSETTGITYVFFVKDDLDAYFEVNETDGGRYLFKSYHDEDGRLCAEVTNQGNGHVMYIVKTDG